MCCLCVTEVTPILCLRLLSNIVSVSAAQLESRKINDSATNQEIIFYLSLSALFKVGLYDISSFVRPCNNENV